MRDNHFTPVWNTEYSESILGNGSLTGWCDDEEIVHVVMTIGTTTRIGKGDWSFKMPNYIGNLSSLGFSTAENMGMRRHSGYALFDPMDRLLIPVFPGHPHDTYSQYPVDTYRPFTWGNGDKLRLSIYKLGEPTCRTEQSV